MANIKVEIEDGVQEVSKFARALVAKRIAIIAALTIILNLALSYGWITPDLSDHALSLVTSILDGVAGLLAIAVIHPKVTPVSDPRDNEGNALVPANTTVTATTSADDSLTVKVNSVPVETTVQDLEPDTSVDDPDTLAVVETNNQPTAPVVPAPPVPPTVVDTPVVSGTPVV